MRYQLKILKNLVTYKYKYLLIIYFIFDYLVIISNFFSGNICDQHFFDQLIGLIFFDNYSFISLLWFLFQAFFIIYTSYYYLFYEDDNSYEFLSLRLSMFKMLINKFLFLIIFIVLFRTLSYFLSLFLFLEFNFIRLFYSIVNFMVIGIFVFLFYVFKHFFA